MTQSEQNSTGHAREVTGKTLLVTGAGSGIGRAAAQVFAAAGVNVIATDRNLESVQSTQQTVEEAGGSCRAAVLDVEDEESVQGVVIECAEFFGGIDFVLNNAGVSAFSRLEDSQYQQVWERAIAVMLTGPQLVVRMALPWLLASSLPRIVNIASTEALIAAKYDSPYCAAKAGLLGFTRALAVELAEHNITVNAICPGPIDTPMTQAIPEEQKRKYLHRRIPLNRYGRPEDIAHMALNLCLPSSGFITGATHLVDGGLSSRSA